MIITPKKPGVSLGPGEYMETSSFEYVKNNHSFNIANTALYHELHRETIGAEKKSPFESLYSSRPLPTKSAKTTSRKLEKKAPSASKQQNSDSIGDQKGQADMGPEPRVSNLEQPNPLANDLEPARAEPVQPPEKEGSSEAPLNVSNELLF